MKIKKDKVIELPDQVADVLRDFTDVMPLELLKNLPLRRAIDHRIELLPGSSPPIHPPYRMSPLELAELRK